jgi:hypothetical protein
MLGEEHPDTVRSLFNLAVTHHLQHRYEEAEELYMRCAELQRRVPDTRLPPGNTLYNLACVAALRENRSAALDWFRQAVKQGFGEQELPYDSIYEDPELSSLHGDPDFEALVAEMRRRNEEEAAAESP